MSSSRIARSLLLRTSSSAFHTSTRQLRIAPRAIIKSANSRFNSQLKPQQPQQSKRNYSQEAPLSSNPSKLYTFEEIQTHISTPPSKKSYILIDVREPSELATTGTIPGSKNIPITSKPDSFSISKEEFEERYGFERPEKEHEVVFFCKAGVRSRVAAELARQGGWWRVGEYPGAWAEWESRGGKSEPVK